MKTKETIGVYILHNPSTKETYVGSGVLELREKRHFRNLENGRIGATTVKGKPLRHQNRKLQAAYNRDPNFEFISIPVSTREEAFDFEQVIIDDFYGKPLFLNMSHDARAGAYNATEESKQKMSQAAKGKPKTPEHKEKIRTNTKTQWEDPVYRETMLTANRTRISINGTVYGSIKEAASILGIPASTIPYRLSNPREKDYFCID